MLYREIIAVRSKIHTEHINKMCGQNVEILIVKLAVHKESLRLKRLKYTLQESHLGNNKDGKVRYSAH